MEKLYFASDYMETAAPEIIERLAALAGRKFTGYGSDEISESAREKIRTAAGTPEGEVYFLVGGTQTNATVIDTMLRPYEGVIAAVTGHVSVHEAGAIEYGGHKVLAVPAEEGKIRAKDIDSLAETYWNDENHEHMVMPAMVYISQPTEYGTLYSLEELREISGVCRKWKLALYVDGARLAYGLSARGNDVTVKDLASLTDVFYIGGTKCGALLGEAVVFPKKGTVPHFFTMVKQHGALWPKAGQQACSSTPSSPAAFMKNWAETATKWRTVSGRPSMKRIRPGRKKQHQPDFPDPHPRGGPAPFRKSGNGILGK